MIRNYVQADGSRRLRWRCIFFLSYEGEIIVRNCLHGEELLERREAARSHLPFWIFVPLVPPLPYISLQLIISMLKYTVNNMILISYILLKFK